MKNLIKLLVDNQKWGAASGRFDPMDALERAIECLGSVAALASAVNVATSAPSMWKKRNNVPAEHCPAIEGATRRRHADDPTRAIVTCEELRPDVGWDVLRLATLPTTSEAGPSGERRGYEDRRLGGRRRASDDRRAADATRRRDGDRQKR